MSILEIDDLKYELPDKMLYENGSLRLNKGEHLGLTGKNGAGKSTLLKMIQGDIMPDEGRIVWQNNITISYLEQQLTYQEGDTMFDYLKQAFSHLYKISDEIQEMYEEYATTYDDELLETIGKKQEKLEASDFYSIETQIEQVANGLGLTAIGLDKEVAKLSGGQRSKVSLAKLLLEKADVFLLDEPTNYLDVSHIDWLSDYLNQLDSTYIVISHDRDFLNKVTTCICDIDYHTLTKYNGNLESAMKQKQAKAEQHQRDYEKQQKEIDKLEAYVRKYKAGSRSNMAKSREKQLNKIDRLAAPPSGKPGKFDFPYEMSHSHLVLETNDLSVGYEFPLLEDINFRLHKGEKIAIKGFNGIGKSTLLKTLIGEIDKLSGTIEISNDVKINYFSQDLNWEHPNQSAIDWLQVVHPKLSNKEVRRVLSKSGINDDNMSKPLSQLSGGEQCKVKLCHLTLIKSNLLVLDEPTNHLDQQSKDSLKHTLNQFEGTVLLVSHEMDFLEDLVDQVYDVALGKMI